MSGLSPIACFPSVISRGTQTLHTTVNNSSNVEIFVWLVPSSELGMNLEINCQLDGYLGKSKRIEVLSCCRRDRFS